MSNSSAITPFAYEGQQLRARLIDETPCVLLADIIASLGMKSTPAQVAQRLPDGVRRMDTITDSLGREQQATWVTEAGLYRVVLRSDSPQAEPFIEWITSDVLPAIRRTGSYGRPELPSKATLAQWVIESEQAREIAEAKVRELEPQAGAWRDLVCADGDYDSRAAAQILCRAGVETGQNRLRQALRELGWVGKDNRPYQAQVDRGRLVERMSTWVDPSGVSHVTYQLRITPKGLAALRTALIADHALIQPALDGVEDTAARWAAELGGVV